jgi:hypothetical protein
VASGVALALLSAGATLESKPGCPIVFRKGTMTMDPFIEVPKIVSGEVALAEWQAKCHAIGIAGRSLGPQAAAVN